MIPTNVMPFPDIRHARRCGGCPECARSDGYINLGREHWFICREHRTRWFGGTNLFDTWKNQTVAQSQSAEILLRGFREVLPGRVAADRQPPPMRQYL